MKKILDFIVSVIGFVVAFFMTIATLIFLIIVNALPMVVAILILIKLFG